LDKWASIALNWQEDTTRRSEIKSSKPKAERKKIKGYSEKICSYLKERGATATISQRALAKHLIIRKNIV